MEDYGPPLDDQGWKEIITRLQAFAEDQISIYNWYRGDNALPKGMTAEDFVQETIFKYLEDPSIYNPEKGEFLSFLKYYFLRRLVYNLSVKRENSLGQDMSQPDSDDEDVNYEDYLPGTVLDIENEIDLNKITDLIIERMDGQIILENIFEGIFISNLKRREVCEQYQISENDYDNAIRRLNTIIKAVKLLIK